MMAVKFEEASTSGVGLKGRRGDPVCRGVGWDEIDLAIIDADPHNLRVITPHSIQEMADSIEEHGLLQNIVVEEVPGMGRFTTRAGNRRLLAVKKLASEGKWPSGKLVCLIVGDGTWSQLVENVVRQDVPQWRLGARLVELRAAGYTKQNIASRIGMTLGKTSMLMQIAEGLHPGTVVRLEQLPAATLTITDLCALSRLFNPETYQPDEEAQTKLLNKFLTRARQPGRGPHKPVTERQVVWRRYRKLKEGAVRVPKYAETYVDAIVRYLAGEAERLSFR